MALYHSEALADLGLQESKTEVAEHFREYKGRVVLWRRTTSKTTTDSKQCSLGNSQAASILFEHDLQALHGMTGEANDRFKPSRRIKSWDSIGQPVVLFERNLYGHLVVGLFWVRRVEEEGLTWECLSVYRNGNCKLRFIFQTNHRHWSKNVELRHGKTCPN